MIRQKGERPFLALSAVYKQTGSKLNPARLHLFPVEVSTRKLVAALDMEHVLFALGSIHFFYGALISIK